MSSEVVVLDGPERFFVITGGPGSGKSMLAAALQESGIHTMPEAGRAIIQDQVATKGTVLPWADRKAFARLMLDWDVRSYCAARSMSGPVIFDRGLPDVIGYLRLCGLPVPPEFLEGATVHRYHRRVLIAPFWPEIFVGDAERKQSLEEAQETYQALAEAYTSLGYELVHLPLAPVQERVKFVVDILDLYPNLQSPPGKETS